MLGTARDNGEDVWGALHTIVCLGQARHKKPVQKANTLVCYEPSSSALTGVCTVAYSDSNPIVMHAKGGGMLR